MDLRQLEYFVAVAEELHFGRAAERTFVAQPALSRRIKGLEEELGTVLFKRTSRKVSLTDEGAYLLGEARCILGRVRNAAETVGRMARGEAGLLRIQFVGPASQSTFPEALRDFRKCYPDIRLELKEGATNTQLAAIRKGDIHIGLIRSYHHDLSDLNELTFSREPYVLALPEEHPLAREKAITLEMFDGLECIDYPRHYQPRLHDDLDRVYAEAGVQPVVVQESTTKQSAIALVAAGMGATLVPGSMYKLQRAGVVYRPLADPNPLPCVKLKLVWRKEENAAVDSFVRVLGRNTVASRRCSGKQ